MAARRECVHVLLLGPSRSGKTAMFQRYILNTFPEPHEPTRGISSFVASPRGDAHPDGRLDMMLKDSGALPPLATISASYVIACNVAIFVFDITSLDSFEAIPPMVAEFVQANHANAKILVVGNKLDLEDQRQVPHDTARGWCEERGYHYLETSAKDDINIKSAFLHHILPEEAAAALFQPPK